MLLSREAKNWLLSAALLATVTSCNFLDSFVPKDGATTDVIDRQQNLTIDDFRDLGKIDTEKEGSGDVKVSAKLGVPALPDIAQVLAAPRPPKVTNAKLVTLAVTQDVPIRDVLFELGRLANVDIEVGTGLDAAGSGINLRTTDQPFNEVIERIADLAQLRYSVNGNTIRVERDTPFIKNYSLDFLNIVRSSGSSYNVNTSILGGGSGGGGGGGGGGTQGSGTVGTSGSSSNIDSQSSSDMWTSLQLSLNEIISYSSGNAAASGSAASGTTPAAAGGGSVVLNRQAGVMTANATERQHEMIQRYLTLMSRNSSAQVLIEAKIVEVSLLDQFVSGVNWNQVLGTVGKNYARVGQYAGIITSTSGDAPSLGSTTAVDTPSFALGLEAGDLDFVVRAAQKFGTTRTLSSPRLSATNNQHAILTFARNEVFFDCETTPTTYITTGGGVSTPVPGTTTCEASSVPIGIILNILPSINLDKQEVTLNVRPTLTRKVGEVPDPTQVNNFYPVIEVRELDSVMKVTSGSVMVIGGLMEDSSRNTSDGVPGLNEIPILGKLFSGRSEDALKRELIIFIKATIVNPDGSADSIDRKVYNKFLTDPRPLFPKQ